MKEKRLLIVTRAGEGTAISTCKNETSGASGRANVTRVQLRSCCGPQMGRDGALLTDPCSRSHDTPPAAGLKGSSASDGPQHGTGCQ